MEELKISYALLLKALATLKKSFYVLDSLKEQGIQEFIEAGEDSCVQRFEYSYDSF